MSVRPQLAAVVAHTRNHPGMCFDNAWPVKKELVLVRQVTGMKLQRLLPHIKCARDRDSAVNAVTSPIANAVPASRVHEHAPDYFRAVAIPLLWGISLLWVVGTGSAGSVVVFMRELDDARARVPSSCSIIRKMRWFCTSNAFPAVDQDCLPKTWRQGLVLRSARGASGDFQGDETVDYAFMGQNPAAADNRWLREAFENRVLIIYFLGIAPGRRHVILPTFICGSVQHRVEGARMGLGGIKGRVALGL